MYKLNKYYSAKNADSTSMKLSPCSPEFSKENASHLRFSPQPALHCFYLRYFQLRN